MDNCRKHWRANAFQYHQQQFQPKEINFVLNGRDAGPDKKDLIDERLFSKLPQALWAVLPSGSLYIWQLNAQERQQDGSRRANGSLQCHYWQHQALPEYDVLVKAYHNEHGQTQMQRSFGDMDFLVLHKPKTQWTTGARGAAFERQLHPIHMQAFAMSQQEPPMQRTAATRVDMTTYSARPWGDGHAIDHADTKMRAQEAYTSSRRSKSSSSDPDNHIPEPLPINWWGQQARNNLVGICRDESSLGAYCQHVFYDFEGVGAKRNASADHYLVPSGVWFNLLNKAKGFELSRSYEVPWNTDFHAKKASVFKADHGFEHPARHGLNSPAADMFFGMRQPFIPSPVTIDTWDIGQVSVMYTTMLNGAMYPYKGDGRSSLYWPKRLYYLRQASVLEFDSFVARLELLELLADLQPAATAPHSLKLSHRKEFEGWSKAARDTADDLFKHVVKGLEGFEASQLVRDMASRLPAMRDVGWEGAFKCNDFHEAARQLHRDLSTMLENCRPIANDGDAHVDDDDGFQLPRYYGGNVEDLRTPEVGRGAANGVTLRWVQDGDDVATPTYGGDDGLDSGLPSGRTTIPRRQAAYTANSASSSASVAAAASSSSSTTAGASTSAVTARARPVDGADGSGAARLLDRLNAVAAESQGHAVPPRDNPREQPPHGRPLPSSPSSDSSSDASSSRASEASDDGSAVGPLTRSKKMEDLTQAVEDSVDEFHGALDALISEFGNKAKTWAGYFNRDGDHRPAGKPGHPHAYSINRRLAEVAKQIAVRLQLLPSHNTDDDDALLDHLHYDVKVFLKNVYKKCRGLKQVRQRHELLKEEVAKPEWASKIAGALYCRHMAFMFQQGVHLG